LFQRSSFNYRQSEAVAMPAEKPSRSKSTWKSWFAKVGLLTATLLLLVICLEFATRCLTDITPPITIRDTKVGATYIPDYEGDFFVEEIQEHVRLRFNRDGFRGEDRPVGKQPGTIRVALMGDSMIAGLALVEEKLLTSHLQQTLNANRPDVNWEVMNFGVSGASTAQQIALYREVVSKYEPDIVLSTFFVGNDLSDNSKRFSSNPRIYFDFDRDDNFYQLPYSVSRSKVSHWLNRNSRFYVWQKRATQLARRSVRKSSRRSGATNWVYSKVDSDDSKHAWRVTAKAVETLRDEVTEHGKTFAVVVMPEAAQVYNELFEEVLVASGDMQQDLDVDQPDNRLREICDGLDVACWSIAADFRGYASSRSFREKDEWLFLYGRGHLNEAGHRVAAASLQRFLLEVQDENAGRSIAKLSIERR